MVAWFCLHLTNNYIDLSNEYVDLSDNYVHLLDLNVDLSDDYVHLLDFNVYICQNIFSLPLLLHCYYHDYEELIIVHFNWFFFQET